MKTTLTIFIVLLLSSLVITYSQKQPPPLAQGQPRPEATSESTKKEVNTKTDRNTSPTPASAVVNKVYAPQDKAAHQQTEAKQAKQKKWSLWGMNEVFNCLLVIFTGLLVICNILLWKSTQESAKAATKAANAAKKSADHIPAIERAYVYMSSVSADFESWRNTESNQLSPIIIEVRNYGKTPAKLTEIITNFQIGESRGSKIIWGTTDEDEIIAAVGRFIASNSDEKFSHYIHDAIGSGDYYIKFFGEVRYIDIFGKDHIAYFNWTLVSRFNRGFYINNPEANYTT